MLTVITAPPWNWRKSKPKTKPKPKPSASLWNKSEFMRTLRRVGPLLLITIAGILVLSACCPPQLAVYRKPEPYPLPPQTMMDYQPANIDLLPTERLPSKSAKHGLTAR